MRHTLCVVLVTVLCVGGFAIPAARGQAVAGSDGALTGPLAGLAEATAKVGMRDHLPAKLSGLLWPTTGTNQQKWMVKKVGVQGKETTEVQYLMVRPDNGDMVLAHDTETKPAEDTKIRRENYYRTTTHGDLVMALKVTFFFKVSDTDSDVLKNVTWETYGETGGDGTQSLAITPEVKAQFEAEKKFWLKQEKKLKKQEHAQTQ